jgi:hypothetical protein
MRVLRNGLGQPTGQHRVDFNGRDGGAAVEQGQRERPEARPDLEDKVRPADPGGRDHTSHRVGVVNEVLAE